VYTKPGALLLSDTTNSLVSTKVGEAIDVSTNLENQRTPLPDNAFTPIRVEADSMMSFYGVQLDIPMEVGLEM